MITFSEIENPATNYKFRLFHNLLFQTTAATKEWFVWYFDIIGEGKTKAYGMFDNDQLVGCWCVEPKKFMLNNSIIDVGRCFSVGIHPNYRFKGLFVELSKYAISKERDRNLFDYILGFPQIGKPVTIGHMKAGWKYIQAIEIQSFKSELKFKNVSLNNVSIIKNFNDVPTPNLKCSGFVETSDYRNDRWINHPNNHYICLSLNDAYIVIKQYGLAGHILDIRGTAINDIEILLNAAQTLSRQHSMNELTIWCASNEINYDLIKSVGFEPGSKYGLSIDFLAVNIKATETLQTHNITSHFAMGIEEIY